jgi:anti-sigma regulatory factor (Ser/Thr protein kinase)
LLLVFPQADDEVTTPPVPVRGRRAWTLSLEDVRVGVHARSHFVEFLHTLWSDEDFLDRAELIFGELLGNVVRHAPGPVELFCDLHPDSIVLHVIDSGPPLSSAKRRLPDDVLSERGRGLFIVAQLASDVRIEPARDHGNHISVKLKR